MASPPSCTNSVKAFLARMCASHYKPSIRHKIGRWVQAAHLPDAEQRYTFSAYFQSA